jgi:hypothetical protein
MMRFSYRAILLALDLTSMQTCSLGTLWVLCISLETPLGNYFDALRNKCSMAPSLCGGCPQVKVVQIRQWMHFLWISFEKWHEWLAYVFLKELCCWIGWSLRKCHCSWFTVWVTCYLTLNNLSVEEDLGFSGPRKLLWKISAWGSHTI